MRQAIEEGFILDVLANYTTYKTYWQIEKAIADDPEYDAGKAQAGHRPVRHRCTRTTSRRRPRSSSSTSASTRATKIGGKAKAMVVTSSRLHAVRYKQAIDKYIAEKGYADIAGARRVLRHGRSTARASTSPSPA